MSEPVLVFATNVQWDGIWYGAQHLGSRLAERGFRVLFLELPVSIASPLRHPERARELVGRRFRRIGRRLVIDRPMGLPPQENARMREVNARLIARRIRHDLKRVGWPEPTFLMVRYGLSWRLAGYFPTSCVVANLSDAFYFTDASWKRERASLLSSADAAVCVSPPLMDEADAAGIRNRLLLPQGVDLDMIRTAVEAGPAPDAARISRPRVGLLGNITPRIDFDLVDAVVSARTDWQFIVVGDVAALFPELRSGTPFAERPNVHLVGQRDRSETGRYLAAFDVAWVPYHWSAFNVASNPLKVMEYLAAGLPVVAPAFPALVGTTSDATLMPESSSAEEWVDALETAMQHASDTERQARRTFAAANSWDARADRLAAFLHELET